MGKLLKNATLVTQNKNKDIIRSDILIENNIIRQIAKDIPNINYEIFDFDNLVIIPGLIQTHVHLCQTLFRNLADDLELLDWLEKRIWPFEMSHTPQSLRISARLGLAELLLSGSTCILDMGNGSFQEIIFEEMVQSGIRGFSGKAMMDTGAQTYKETTSQSLKSTEKLIDMWHRRENDRIQYALAPRFVPSCSKQLWEGVKELSSSNNLIIHTHSSENKDEWKLVKSLTGYSNVEFFVKRSIASPKLCLAHCIWVSETEIKMLADYNINVLHCPSANLKLGSGIAPVPTFLKKGVNVSLGSDGAPCNNNLNMFNEMKMASLIQKPLKGAGVISAEQVFHMATIGGARALGLENKIGSLEVNKKADLVVLDLNKVHCIPADNIYSQIIFSAYASDVIHVMVDGKWTVFNRQLKNFDYHEIISDVCKNLDHLVVCDE
jgi:5-methylthioadenosine/S-adenosylhomocysteine deaminase